ncbi:MAG: S8 family serine peptidase [Acidobacteriota bacterium]
MRSICLFLTLILLVPVVAAADSIDAKIAPELLVQLERDTAKAVTEGAETPMYRVVVDLRQRAVKSHAEMADAFATPEGHARLMADIANLQDSVLGAMATESNDNAFQVWNRYQSTYGFSAYADAEAIRALAGMADVTFVHELPIYYKMDAQAHAITNADNAHAGGTTGAGVTIAVIDDGIDHDHPAFGGSSAWPNSKILGGRDFADNDNNPRIDCTAQSHGTAVTGVAVGDGGGIVGSAPDAKAVFLKIQSASICGQPGLDGDIPGAIDWAVTNRNSFSPAIKIISMSLGTGSTFTNPCSSIAENSALVAARNAGMVTLIASGNSAASNGISSPACHPDAVSVGATYDANIGSANFGNCSDSSTFADKITCYSNSDTFLDILAPSHCARTAQAGGGTNTCFGGTSSATPYAAGIAALIYETNPSISRNAAISALESGTNITDSRNGVTKPRVDALDAIAAAGGGGGGPGGSCAYDNNFESGDVAGWANAGSCSTGAYTINNPTQQVSTVVTQPNGSASGVRSIFTATNSSAGNADVDGGNCILTKTAISVSSPSTLSFNYFHGQRDNGDDPGGDFFNVQYRVNGGAWQTVVSRGDQRTTASWTAASTSVPAGNIELRMQCSDGSGPGDIIECGIDDVKICN